MTVDVTVSREDGVHDTWGLSGEFLTTADEDGVISVHTTEESLYINARHMSSVYVEGAVTT